MNLTRPYISVKSPFLNIFQKIVYETYISSVSIMNTKLFVIQRYLLHKHYIHLIIYEIRIIKTNQNGIVNILKVLNHESELNINLFVLLI